jgi:hypothetical protein
MTKVYDMESSLPLFTNKGERVRGVVQIHRGGCKLAKLAIDAVCAQCGWMCPYCYQFWPTDGHVLPGLVRCGWCKSHSLVMVTLGDEEGLQYFSIPFPE